MTTNRRETFPLADLYRKASADDRSTLTLEPGELITAVTVPQAPDASAYVRAGERAAWSFALCGVAAARVSGRTRLAAIGVSNLPRLLDPDDPLAGLPGLEMTGLEAPAARRPWPRTPCRRSDDRPVSLAAAAVRAPLAALIVPAAATAMPLPQSAVKAKPPPVNEESPSAAPGEFAWVQNSRLHPHLYNAYAQVGGGARFRVNAPGTQAGAGTGIDGHTLAYTQVHGGQQSIRLFDLQTHARRGPPAGVNTPSIEDEPSISGNWLLFHRLEGGPSPGQQVLLANLSTGATRVLASVPGARGFLEAGQVNGNFAVFTQSKTGAVFNVWLYDIAQKTLTVIPNPARQGALRGGREPVRDGLLRAERRGVRQRTRRSRSTRSAGRCSRPGTLKPGVDLFHPFLFEHGAGRRLPVRQDPLPGRRDATSTGRRSRRSGVGDRAVARRRDQRGVLGEARRGCTAAAAGVQSRSRAAISSSESTTRSSRAATSNSIVSPSRTIAIGPPRAASGVTCPAISPWVAPEKRPSVTSATWSPRPSPTMAAVTCSISRMPGPPAGPS